MSDPSVAAEQLLELLLTLKKTTPEAARSILNSQPAIAYALITLMVSMNAFNTEVFQQTLAEYGAGASSPESLVAPSSTISTSISQAVSPSPIPAIPPHLQVQYRGHTPTPTPPTHTPTPPYNYSHPPATTPSTNGLHAGGYGAYSYPTTGTAPSAITPASSSPSILPEALASIPPEQKALIMRVLMMTPEQINLLPPTERATYIQIRTTLGVSSN